MSNLPPEVQRALKEGRKQDAREMLQQLLRENPQNHRAWLWLAGITSSPQASLNYIQQAEKLQPNDPTVARARAWAEKRLAESRPPEQSAAEQPSTRSAAQVTAPPPPPPAPDPVQHLRQRRLAEAAEDERPPSRAGRLLGVLGLLGLLTIAALGLWRWGDSLLALLPSNGAGGEQVAVVEQNPLAAAQSEAPAVSENVAAENVAAEAPRFVSGHFAPKLSDPAQQPQATPTATATTALSSLPAKTNGEAAGEPRATWTVTPSPTNTPSPTPTPVPTFISEETQPSTVVLRPDGVGPNERWIDINLTTQTLVAYEGNTAVYQSLVSSGTYLHPTVTGQFRVWLRYEAQTMDGTRLGYNYYLPNVPYVMYFYRDYAIHGTYWHNNFGTPMSHGCVNMPTPAAEWLYYWSDYGTLVNVHY